MMRKPVRYPRFKGYTGKAMWRVTHPVHGLLEVIAPSKPAAVIVAADKWGENWKSADFYLDCQCNYLGLKGSTVEIREAVV